MAAHDALGRREPEPTPGGLGGEERVEDLEDGLLHHAAAGVRHLEIDVFALGQVLAELEVAQVRAIEPDEPGRDTDHTALLADRLGAVEHEVHDQLTELGWVALN